jgi:hypothetical protein
VLALFEQGGYRASDLTTYEKQYELPKVSVKLVAVNGSPTGANGVDLEVDLISMRRSASTRRSSKSLSILTATRMTASRPVCSTT